MSILGNMGVVVLQCLLVFLPVLVTVDFVAAAPHEIVVGEGIHVYSIKIDSQITSRFAHNVITSRAVNTANSSKEVEFDVDLPKTAFITNFSMTIDGRVYLGTVKEKEAAQKVYQEAVSRGQSAGIVKASGRKMEKFKVSVSIAPASKVTFELTYEELLKRTRGRYEMLIRVNPNQLVDHFQITVHISETRALTFLEAEADFLTNELMQTVKKTFAGKEGHVSFSPTVDEQRRCAGCQTSLLNGDLPIKYDVERDTSAGDIQIVNGYFVHFFAPENIPSVPKNVIFIIDVSGSMIGRKMDQTKAAFQKISQDLREEDYFNFVIFSSRITLWKTSLVSATTQNVDEAKTYISSLRAEGYTNINEALLSAAKQLDESVSREELAGRRFSLILFLTDGEPSTGEMNKENIIANAKEAIRGRYTLYSLGFGSDVDYNFLEKLALGNGGLARRIYEDSDAAVQLQGFYDEIANPLLLGVQMKYPDNSVNEITTNTFTHYYQGSEIVVAGRVAEKELTTLPVEIRGEGAKSNFTFNMEGKVQEALKQQQYIFGEYTERLWAYLTIQQLLEKHVSAQGTEKEALRAKALELSLHYSFVTPMASMVVTKPDHEEKNSTLVADKLTEAQRTGDGGAPTSRLHSPARLQNSAGGQPVHSPARLQTSAGGQPASNRGSSRSFVDGDPHFIIQLPNRNESLCFNIQENPGVILRLVKDPVTGISVNGQVVGKNKDGSAGKAGNTYIGKLGFVSQKMRVKVMVTTQTATVFIHQQKISLPWEETTNIAQEGFTLSISKGSKMILSFGEDATFEVVLHRPSKKHPKHNDFLGLYTMDSHQLSAQTHGLLGQFYHDIDFQVHDISRSDPKESSAILAIEGHEMKVKGQWQEDFRADPQDGVNIFCWLVQESGKGLIDGSASDYIVSSLFDILFTFKTAV